MYDVKSDNVVQVNYTIVFFTRSLEYDDSKRAETENRVEIDFFVNNTNYFLVDLIYENLVLMDMKCKHVLLLFIKKISPFARIITEIFIFFQIK